MKYSFLPSAIIELQDAINYYEECQYGLGLEFAGEIFSTIQQIGENIRKKRICDHKEKMRHIMIELQYSLVIEATEEPDYFGFYSPDLEGFTGLGHSVEDCLYSAKWGMAEHVRLLKEQGLPIPPNNPDPKIIIQNENKEAVTR